MRDVTAKSIKLNRDLEKMLEQALERELGRGLQERGGAVDAVGIDINIGRGGRHEDWRVDF